MTVQKDAIGAALDVLGALVAGMARYDAVNAELKSLQGDFYSHQAPMSGEIHDRVVAMLDTVLGDELASYFLYDCRTMVGGGRIVDDGRSWPIRDMDDVRAYALRDPHARRPAGPDGGMGPGVP